MWGDELAAKGADELSTAAELQEVARDMAAEGIAEEIEGATKVGAGATGEVMADEMKKQAE